MQNIENFFESVSMRKIHFVVNLLKYNKLSAYWLWFVNSMSKISLRQLIRQGNDEWCIPVETIILGPECLRPKTPAANFVQ